MKELQGKYIFVFHAWSKTMLVSTMNFPVDLTVKGFSFCRFATVKYSPPTDQNVDIVFMHLTNYSLNKFSQSYVPDGEGSKR